MYRGDLPPRSLALHPRHPSAAWRCPMRHPIGMTLLEGFRNIDRISIGYASRPRLRSRLTLGGLSLPRKPWTYGVRVFHPHFRILMPAFSFPIILAQETLDLRCAGFSPAFSHTHASILVSGTSSGHRHPPSQACGTLSYHSVARVHDFGDVFSPDHFRRGVA